MSFCTVPHSTYVKNQQRQGVKFRRHCIDWRSFWRDVERRLPLAEFKARKLSPSAGRAAFLPRARRARDKAAP